MFLNDFQKKTFQQFSKCDLYSLMLSSMTEKAFIMYTEDFYFK